MSGRPGRVLSVGFGIVSNRRSAVGAMTTLHCNTSQRRNTRNRGLGADCSDRELMGCWGGILAHRFPQDVLGPHLPLIFHPLLKDRPFALWRQPVDGSKHRAWSCARGALFPSLRDYRRGACTISKAETGLAWLFLPIQGSAEGVGTSVGADGAGCGRFRRPVGVIHDVGWTRTTQERILGLWGRRSSRWNRQGGPRRGCILHLIPMRHGWSSYVRWIGSIRRLIPYSTQRPMYASHKMGEWIEQAKAIHMHKTIKLLDHPSPRRYSYWWWTMGRIARRPIPRSGGRGLSRYYLGICNGHSRLPQ